MFARTLALLPALSLACAELPQDDHATRPAVTRDASAERFALRKTLRNTTIRQTGSTYTVSMDVSGGAVADIVDEIEAIEVEFGDAGVVELEPERGTARGGFVHDMGEEDPTGGSYAIALTVTGRTGDVTVTDTLTATVEATGDTARFTSDTLGAEVWVRAVAARDTALDGTWDLLLDTALHLTPNNEDGSTAPTWSWSGSSTARAANRSSPTPIDATVAASLDDEGVTYSAEIAFAGDPVGTTWALDAVAYGADGGRAARGEFAVQFVQIRDEEGNPGPVLGVTANGKGTRVSASNTSTRATLL